MNLLKLKIYSSSKHIISNLIWDIYGTKELEPMWDYLFDNIKDHIDDNFLFVLKAVIWNGVYDVPYFILNSIEVQNE